MGKIKTLQTRREIKKLLTAPVEEGQSKVFLFYAL